MPTATYALSRSDVVLSHSPALAWFLRDVPRNPEELQMSAQAASGDYFATLAAELEQVAAVLPQESGEQYRLQAMVTTLLYLQNNYTIRKKP